MEQGLKTQAEEKAANNFVTEQVDAAVFWAAKAKNDPDIQGWTTEDQNKLADQKTKNPFYNRVEDILAKAENDDKRGEGLAALKKDAFDAMKKGAPKKGAGDIISGNLANIGEEITSNISFDIMHPIDSLMSIPRQIFGVLSRIVSTIIKDVAVSFMSEKAAGSMKAFEHNWLDNLGNRLGGKPFEKMTTEQAAQSLRAQNALEGLAVYLGTDQKDFKAREDFCKAHTSQIEKSLGDVASGKTTVGQPSNEMTVQAQQAALQAVMLMQGVSAVDLHAMASLKSLPPPPAGMASPAK